MGILPDPARVARRFLARKDSDTAFAKAVKITPDWLFDEAREYVRTYEVEDYDVEYEQESYIDSRKPEIGVLIPLKARDIETYNFGNGTGMLTTSAREGD